MACSCYSIAPWPSYTDVDIAGSCRRRLSQSLGSLWMTVPSTMSVEAGSVGCNTEELAKCGPVVFAYSSYARG